MKIVLLSISLILNCVSGNPAPQIFGYQPPNNPVGQLVQQGLQGIQNSLQSVSNALQGGIFNPFTRPETQSQNQISVGPSPIQTGPIPNGPYGNGPIPNRPIHNIQTVPVPPIPYEPQLIQTVPNAPYGNVPFGNGQIHIQNVPVPPIPYDHQPVQIIPNGPNGPWPYRQIESDDQQNKPISWVPFPLHSQFGDPFIIIISRPSRHPLSPPGTQPHVNASDSNQVHSAKPSQSALDSANISPTTTTTPGPNTETEPTLATSTYPPENASNVPNLGLTMTNTVSVPLAPIETTNTSGQMPLPAVE